jgi:hypothetical protein
MKAMADRLGANLPTSGQGGRRALHAEVTKLHAAATALEKLRANADPTVTPAAHAKRVMSAAAKLKEQVASARDRAHRIMHDGATDIDRRIAAKVNLKPDAFAAEIRATFRGMPPERQLRVLAELATQNRGPELAALIEAPGIVTGLTGDLQNRYRDLIVSTHASEEHAEQAELMEAFLATLDMMPVASAVADALSDPAKLAEIERGEAAAAEAAAAFDSAVS